MKFLAFSNELSVDHTAFIKYPWEPHNIAPVLQLQAVTFQFNQLTLASVPAESRRDD